MSAIRRDIFTLLQNYASLTPLRFIQFPPKISFSDMNSNLVDFILLNPLLQKYPPSKQYQRSFWKAAISHLETLLAESNGEDEEIDPRILDHYLSILPSSGPLSGSSSAELRDQICDRGLPLGEMPSRSFVTHFWRLDLVQESISGVVNLADYQSSSVEESRTMIERGTTGLRTWFASHMLARYLMQNTSIVEGKRLLELGSGTGFLGIIAASLQQLQLNSKKTTLLESSSVWLTDVNEEVLTQCRRNVQLPCNLSSTHQFMHFQLLDWEEALKPDVATLKDYLQNEINPDVILGADLVRSV
ncbi:hypothetical protein GYMLUDRAFT_32580 [Collybiopsis luxurians FD-317 M1]|nr:hypothetical protein GYMLUDRAFT_32580 [Collybiopsis luxurians FD-317 M1]